MDWKEKINKAINKAGEKAGELTQQAKVKIEEQKLKTQIANKYKAIGEKIYFSKKEDFSDAEILEAINTFVGEVDLLNVELEKLAIEEIIEEEGLETEVLCTACGASNAPEAKFCNNCGGTL